MPTYEQAVQWATEMGLKIRRNDQAAQCWIDRVYLAHITSKEEHKAEANRYA